MITTSLLSVGVDAWAPIPMVVLRFRLLREGEVTPATKTLRVYRSWASAWDICLSFQAEAGNGGEYTQATRVSLAALLEQGEWLVGGNDPTPPRKTRAAYLAFTQGGDYTFNITSGEGAQQGDPAQVDGLVRVDGQSASREIVLVERPADGQWRLAGYGSTPGGAGKIDVRVTGGELYALSIDDVGVAFAPSLVVAVGQRIRPSVFTGVLYQVTEPGVLPATEPAWWPITSGGSRELGTARAEAVRYYRPLAHGPVTAEPS